MKYEVIEELYRLTKNNGETFRINKIKWQNSEKYDVRIWRDDTPMLGIVLSSDELVQLCRKILLNQGVTNVFEPDEDDFLINKEMSEFGLWWIISDHPECLDSSRKLRSVLKDYIPEYKREINILCNLFDLGIADFMSKVSVLNISDVNRFSKLAENEFGLKMYYSLWGIKMWADAYDVNYDHELFDNDSHHYKVEKHDTSNFFGDKSNLYCVDDDLFNNYNILITYKGLKNESSGTMFWAGFVLYVKNYTDLPARVEMSDIEINGFQVRNSGYIDVSPKMQTISGNILTNIDDMKMLGIKTCQDIKKIKLTVKYTINRNADSKTVMLEAKEY